MIPFTTEQFLGNFEIYNQAIYPLQWMLVLFSLVSVFLLLRSGSTPSRIIAASLAGLWLWSGVVYHLIFFSRINKAAYLFGFLFTIQAGIFFLAGVVRASLRFWVRVNLTGAVGALLIIYALAIYPLLAYSFGHGYPRMPTFGAPCPTTIFSLGILLCTAARVPWYVLVIPLVWSIVGSTATIYFGMYEDAGLLLSGLLATVLLGTRKRSSFDSRRCADIDGLDLLN